MTIFFKMLLTMPRIALVIVSVYLLYSCECSSLRNPRSLEPVESFLNKETSEQKPDVTVADTAALDSRRSDGAKPQLTEVPTKTNAQRIPLSISIGPHNVKTSNSSEFAAKVVDPVKKKDSVKALSNDNSASTAAIPNSTPPGESHQSTPDLALHGQADEADAKLRSAKQSPNKAVVVRRNRRSRILSRPYQSTRPKMDADDLDGHVKNGTTNAGDLEGGLAAFHNRRAEVMLGLVALLFILQVTFQSGVNCLARTVYKSSDRYLHLVFETIFRQLATILMVAAVILLLLRINVVEFGLEHRLFGDYAKFVPRDGDASESQIESIFDVLLSVAMAFTVVYIFFVLYYAVIARDTISWLSNLDGSNIEVMLENRRSGRMDRATKQALDHAALRFEFEDTVEHNGVPGLDPAGYYFAEYLRSCYLYCSVGVLKISVTSLMGALLLSLALFPLAKTQGIWEILFLLVTAATFLTIVCLIFLHIRGIEAKIRPKKAYEYVNHRHLITIGNCAEDPKLILSTGPPYKLLKPARGCLCRPWLRFAYGTDFPYRHESLFFLWKRGPGFLARLIEFCYFCNMIIVSFLVVAGDRHEKVWWHTYGWWPFFSVLGVCALQLCIFPSLMWRLTVITASGELIQSSILQDVWEDQRAGTVRRSAQFIDQIRMDAMLCDIEEGGESYWSSLFASSSILPPDVAEQNRAVFRKLDPDQDGLLRPPQFYQWIVSQGLCVEGMTQATAWFSVFDRDRDGGLNFGEFQVVVFVVKRLLSETMDSDSIMRLLESRYSIMVADHIVMDQRLLKIVLKKLNQRWTDSQIRHFLDYVAGQRAKELPVPDFIERLRVLESETLGALHQAVDRLKTKPMNDP